MNVIDWKTLAPRRADWERLSAVFEADGLPRCRWRNGVPGFDGEVDWYRVDELAHGTAMPRPTLPPEPSKSSEQPVKRGRGRQRTK